ncbi:hypothetical protein ACHAXT_007313 [Thalassiosira profunda]
MSSSRGQQQQASTCRCRRCTLSHLLGGVVGPAEDGPCTNPSQNNALSMADELSGLLPALASQSSAQDAVMAVPIRVRMAIVRTSSYSAAPPKGGFPSYEDTPLERKLETYYPPVTAYGGNSAAEATVAELTEYIVEELFVGNKEGHFWERDREAFVKMLLGDEWEGTLPNVIFRYTAGKMNGQRSGGKLTNGGKKALRATWVVHFSLSEKCEGDFVDVSSTANAYKTLRGIQSQVPKGKKADLLLKAHVLCSEEGKDAPPKRKRKGLTEKGSKDDDGGTPKRKKVVTADAKVPVSITKYPNGIPPALSEAWENQKMAESSPKRKKKADAMEVERPSAAAAKKPPSKKAATSAKVDSKDDDSATESSEDEAGGDKAFDFAALGKKKVDDELESPSSSSSSSEEDESQESDAEDRDAMQVERGVDKPNTSDRKATNVKEAAKKASAKAAAMNEANKNGSTAAAGNKKAKIDEEAESSSSESSSSEEDESDESDTEGGGINTDTNQQKKAPVSKRSNSVAGSKAKARVAVGKKKATIDEKSESSSASSSGDEGGSDSDEEESAEKESGKQKGASSKVLSVVSSDAGDDGKDESIPEEKAEQDAEADSSSGSSSDSSSSSEESDDDGEDDDKGKKTTTAWVRKGVGAPVQQTMEKSKGVTFKLDAAGKATPYDLATTDSDPNFTQESAIVPKDLFGGKGSQQKAQKKRSKGDVPVDESDDDSASSSSSGSSSSDSEESDDGEGGLQTTTKPKHSAANSGRDDSEGESSGDDEEGAKGKPAQDTDANNDAESSSSGSGSSSDSSSDSDSDSSSSSEEAEEEKKVTKKKETTPSSSALPVVRSSRGRRRTPLVSMSKKIVINPSNGKSKARTFAR